MGWVYPAVKRLRKIRSRDDGVYHKGEQNGRKIRNVLGLTEYYAPLKKMRFWLKIPKRFWLMTEKGEKLDWNCPPGKFYREIPFELLSPYLDYCEISIDTMWPQIGLKLDLRTPFSRLVLYSKDITFDNAPQEIIEIVGELNRWQSHAEINRELVKRRDPAHPLYRRQK